MATAKSKKAEEAVESVKAAAAEAVESVKAAAGEAAKKGEAAVQATKRAAKKVVEQAAEKAEPVKKAVAAKRTKKAEITAKVVVELSDKGESTDALIDRAKADWIAKGNSLDDIKELALYINACEGMVYYVVNDDYLSGSFVF